MNLYIKRGKELIKVLSSSQFRKKLGISTDTLQKRRIQNYYIFNVDYFKIEDEYFYKE